MSDKIDGPGLYLELEGRVIIREVDDSGNESVEEMDRLLVLKCLNYCIQKGISLLAEKVKEEEQIPPVDEPCATCGNPKNNHHYRHPFKSKFAKQENSR